MANNKKEKKTAAQAQEYKAALKMPKVPSEGTMALNNSNLLGSNEIVPGDELGVSTEKVEVPIGLRIKRWATKHVSAIIVGVVIAVLGAVVCWCGTTLIDMKVDYAVLSSKISELSEQVDRLNTDSVAKDLLTLQIGALKEELSFAHNIDKAEIEKRLALLEQQIAFLQKNP